MSFTNHEKGFGFVDDVFVPPNIAGEFEHSEEISLIAVKRTNRKTNQLGWAERS